MTVYFSENFDGTGRLIDRPSDSGHVYIDADNADKVILDGSGGASVVEQNNRWAYMETVTSWWPPSLETTVEVVFTITRPFDDLADNDGFEFNLYHRDAITAFTTHDGELVIYGRTADFEATLPLVVGEYRIVVSNGPGGVAWATINEIEQDVSPWPEGAYTSPYTQFNVWNPKRDWEPVVPPIFVLNKIEVRSYEPPPSVAKFWANETLAKEVI
jgi:hypothetical protein